MACCVTSSPTPAHLLQQATSWGSRHTLDKLQVNHDMQMAAVCKGSWAEGLEGCKCDSLQGNLVIGLWQAGGRALQDEGRGTVQILT